MESNGFMLLIATLFFASLGLIGITAANSLGIELSVIDPEIKDHPFFNLLVGSAGMIASVNKLLQLFKKKQTPC